MNLQSVADVVGLVAAAADKAEGAIKDYALVVNLVFCILILVLGFRRWRKESVRAFILVGLGFTCFAVSHTIGLLGPKNLMILSAEFVKAWESPLIYIRGLGYILVIIGLLS